MRLGCPARGCNSLLPPVRGVRDEAARNKFLELLAGGLNVTAAAEGAGVSRRTPYTWAEQGDEQVAAALRGDDESPLPRHPTEIEVEMLETLAAIAQDAEAPAAVRVRAATEVLRRVHPLAAQPAADSQGKPDIAPEPELTPEEAASRWMRMARCAHQRVSRAIPESGALNIELQPPCLFDDDIECDYGQDGLCRHCRQPRADP